MIIGGLQKFSLLDYPGKISAIIFSQGCNFRCHFCYNPMLVRPQVGKIKYPPRGGQKGHQINEDDLFDFLKERQGKLQAVVMTGGEPTLHPDLPSFLSRIKEMEFLIKLDTNGTNPEMLKKLLAAGVIDYIAMDLKASPNKYDKITGVKADFQKIAESVKIIMESRLPYEFRTTVAPGFFTAGDIEAMGKIIKGAEFWYLQKFKSDIPLVDKEFEGLPAVTDQEMKKFAVIGSQHVKRCEVR